MHSHNFSGSICGTITTFDPYIGVPVSPFAIQTLWTSLGWDGGQFGGGKGFFGVEHDRGLRYQKSVVAIVSSAVNAL
jgi:hypothetical protein